MIAIGFGGSETADQSRLFRKKYECVSLVWSLSMSLPQTRVHTCSLVSHSSLSTTLSTLFLILRLYPPVLPHNIVCASLERALKLSFVTAFSVVTPKAKIRFTAGDEDTAKSWAEDILKAQKVLWCLRLCVYYSRQLTTTANVLYRRHDYHHHRAILIANTSIHRLHDLLPHPTLTITTTTIVRILCCATTTYQGHYDTPVEVSPPPEMTQRFVQTHDGRRVERHAYESYVSFFSYCH